MDSGFVTGGGLTIRSSRDRFAARLKWWGVPSRQAAQRSVLTQALAPMFNFYVYVDGADLDQCESTLVQALSQFAATSKLAAKVVNDRHSRTPDLGPEDLPDWNLGLNFWGCLNFCV